MAKMRVSYVRHNMTLAERLEFHSIPEPNSGCLLWLSSCREEPFPYGVMTWKRKTHRVHVLSWELANGMSVPKGMVIRHKCDVPLCINPEHLLLGTPKDNVDDMWMRRRASHSQRHPIAKLTDDNVREIRRSTERHGRLAEKFGVNSSLISMIRAGRVWKHVRP